MRRPTGGLLVAVSVVAGLAAFIVVFLIVVAVRPDPAPPAAGYGPELRSRFVSRCAGRGADVTREICECLYDTAAQTVSYDTFLRYDEALRPPDPPSTAPVAAPTLPPAIETVMAGCVAEARLRGGPNGTTPGTAPVLGTAPAPEPGA